MKREREVDVVEHISACIVVLKNQPGYFDWGDRGLRSHGVSGIKSSPQAIACRAAGEVNSCGEVMAEAFASNTGILPAACFGGELSVALASDKPGSIVRSDDEKLGADQRKERRKKEKRKKHRPKVVEIDKAERKLKIENPIPPQTPNQNPPGKKKGRIIGRRTFARKKPVAKFVEDEDEWEEARDQPSNSVLFSNYSSRRIQEEINEHCVTELIGKNSQPESIDSTTNINIRIDDLLGELAKLPIKSSSPLLLKEELLQLNIESPLDTLSYIVDNIRIPCLLHFAKQGREMTKSGHKLGGNSHHSENKVLEDFIHVLKMFLPSLLLKNDLSVKSGQVLNNKHCKKREGKNGRLKVRFSTSNCQIVPYGHFHKLKSSFRHMETSSCKALVTRNFVSKERITQNRRCSYSTPKHGSKEAMDLALQSVIDKLKLVYIDKDNAVDSTSELQNAIVPFTGGGMIVPYNELFERIKKKPQRVEVLLDSETTRVWKLLEDNEFDDDADGQDSCKLKWWENERRVFLGRAKSFTARMNLILGNRQFSPWKGSVVDSVVGVFLTQNVSDHLSSSAFMSLASKFPLHRRDDEGEISTRTQTNEHEISTDTTTYVNDDANPINYKGQDFMDTQLNGYPPEDLVCQSYHLQNSFLSSAPIDADGCNSKILANFLKSTSDNERNECIDLHHIRSESEPQLDISRLSVNTFATEKEASTSFKFEKYSSSAKKAKTTEERKDYWEGLRRKANHENARSFENLDSINWEAVRTADVKKISDAIRERGMNNLLAERIKDFLNRLVRDHENIDLEWLKNICPDEAKRYLLSIRGLGLKSVECVRLLTLQNVAFPVDTNVARISVRLGWVPLKPLPEFLQLHLLEQYPVMDSVQKYIWPRLCKLDQKQLYELHYHMITFGKVFCTKNRPNCSICPMKGECKHFNSAKLALPAPEDKQTKDSSFLEPPLIGYGPVIPSPQCQYDDSRVSGIFRDKFDPIIEYPPSPPPLPHEIEILDADIEDAFYEDDEIPTIKLNLERFECNLLDFICENDTKVFDDDASNALVELSAEVASIPIRRLKHIRGLRTEHHVYELPDSHHILKEMEQREPDDPSPYLLAIWTPGETAVSTEPPESCLNTKDIGQLCESEACFSCNNRRELEAQTVRGTLLIPCRTAMRGRFPLNGTYFQINEVFADHDSSRLPIHVPRNWLWNLPRRTVYFGTSIAAIFKGFISTEPIQLCFSRGFVCVRGFDRKAREPKPLYARLHLPRSKAPNSKKHWARHEE